MTLGNFTPRETVGELDRYIIGQHKAKRAKPCRLFSSRTIS